MGSTAPKWILRAVCDQPVRQFRETLEALHAFCTYLLQRGADVESVGEVAGHEDLKTTAQDLRGNMEQARQAMARLAEADRGPTVAPSLVLN